MAEITKPSDINKIWASAGDVLAPSDSKIATGWSVEIPPRQWFNYIDHKQDQAIAHINQHGVAVWDNTTEYQWSSTGTKSICMGSNGVIYRAKQISTNQNPITDTINAYWETAFVSLADIYTKAQSDGKYLSKSSNLSDLTNTATARTNLSVYSQSQTYLKTEVDIKVARTLYPLKTSGFVNSAWNTLTDNWDNYDEIIIQYARGSTGGGAKEMRTMYTQIISASDTIAPQFRYSLGTVTTLGTSAIDIQFPETTKNRLHILGLFDDDFIFGVYGRYKIS